MAAFSKIRGSRCSYQSGILLDARFEVKHVPAEGDFGDFGIMNTESLIHASYDRRTVEDLTSSSGKYTDLSNKHWVYTVRSIVQRNIV